MSIITNFLYKLKSRRHDALKKELEILKSQKSLAIIHREPQWKIKVMEARIKKFERKIGR